MRNIGILRHATLLLLLCLCAAQNASAQSGDVLKLSQQQLVSLNKPAVVRIARHVTGEVVFKPFTVDLNKLTIEPAEGESQKIPVDEYSVGSGFIVGKDGAILTNAHVASVYQSKLEVVAMVAQGAIMDAMAFYAQPKEESDQSAESEKYKDFAKRLKEYLLKEGSFQLQSDVVVFNPSSVQTKLENLFSEGFPVQTLQAAESYDEDGVDVAVITIAQRNLPTVSLGQSAMIRAGNVIGVFGFPSSGDIGNNPLVPTFSQGVISARKQFSEGGFSMIQTDAKISEGSSGGPLLDEGGQVIGMITFQSVRQDSGSGDNFAFAIPIDVVEDAIGRLEGESAVSIIAKGEYQKEMGKGFSLLAVSKCRQALVSFGGAIRDMNENFSVAQNVQPYIEQCQSMIAQGKSIDSQWDRTRQLLGLIGWRSWAGAGIALLVIVIISFKLFSMKRRLKKDEREMRLMERDLEHMARRELEESRQLRKLERRIDAIQKNKRMIV